MIHLSDQSVVLLEVKTKKSRNPHTSFCQTKHILDVLHDSLASLANTASVAVLFQLKKMSAIT